MTSATSVPAGTTKPQPAQPLSPLGSWSVLFGLWGLAVAQPLLDLLGRTTAFFLAHRADRMDLVLFALAVCLAGPVLLGLVVLTSRLSGARLRWLETVVWSLLLALVAAHWLSLWTAPAAWVAALALAAGALAAVALRRWRAARTVASWLGAAAWIFPLLFLLVSPARKIGAGSGPENSEPSAAKPLPPVTAVLVVFDEFPLVTLLDDAEEVGRARYPNFAALADTATWYRNATTAAQSTPFAIPTILTGRYPRSAKGIQPVWVDYKTNLFTVIGKSANLHVVETMSRLCPERLCSGQALHAPRRLRLGAMVKDATAVYLHLVTPKKWSDRLPVIGESWRDFWAPPLDSKISGRDNPHKQDVAKVFERFVEDLSAFPPPALHYAHFMAPHLPWTRLPDGTTYRMRQRTPHGLSRQSWEGSEWETVQAHQRHLLHVGWIDTLLGRLREELEDRGLWHDAIVVITSDHGASFETGNLRRNLGKSNFAQIVNIPLFIKYPRQEQGAIDDSNAETVDIMPTVLAAMQAPVPRKLRGVDLAGEARRESKTVYHSGLRARGPGRAETYDPDRVLERRDALARKTQRFGTGSWDGVYSVGAFGSLVGRAVEEIEGAGRAASEPVARLDFEDDLDDVDPRRELQPVHIIGELERTEDGEPVALAVAVNGAVRATTETFRDGDQSRFTALIPKSSLIRGKNEVEILRIEGTAENPRVQRLLRGPARDVEDPE